MKIYIDNELTDFRKIVSIKSSYNIDIHDDINTIIDALRGCGYHEEAIQNAFLKKCIDWKFIEDEEVEDYEE